MIARVKERRSSATPPVSGGWPTGQVVVGVEERDGRFYEDGMEVLPEELVGVLPDCIEALLYRLRQEVQDRILYVMRDGRIFAYIRADLDRDRDLVLPPGLVLADDGTVWLLPMPGGCRNCGHRVFEERYQVLSDGGRCVIDRRCEHCGTEALR